MEFAKGFMSGENETPKDEGYELCEFQIIAGGITTKGQPIDMVLGKIFKGYYREDYDLYMLTAPKITKGNPCLQAVNCMHSGW